MNSCAAKQVLKWIKWLAKISNTIFFDLVAFLFKYLFKFFKRFGLPSFVVVLKTRLRQNPQLAQRFLNYFQLAFIDSRTKQVWSWKYFDFKSNFDPFVYKYFKTIFIKTYLTKPTTKVKKRTWMKLLHIIKKKFPFEY